MIYNELKQFMRNSYILDSSLIAHYDFEEKSNFSKLNIADRFDSLATYSREDQIDKAGDLIFNHYAKFYFESSRIFIDNSANILFD